jgi:hypothetical protein
MTAVRTALVLSWPLLSSGIAPLGEALLHPTGVANLIANAGVTRGEAWFRKCAQPAGERRSGTHRHSGAFGEAGCADDAHASTSRSVCPQASCLEDAAAAPAGTAAPPANCAGVFEPRGGTAVASLGSETEALS